MKCIPCNDPMCLPNSNGSDGIKTNSNGTQITIISKIPEEIKEEEIIEEMEKIRQKSYITRQKSDGNKEDDFFTPNEITKKNDIVGGRTSSCKKSFFFLK